MTRWYSSDHHFGHTNIIKYCNRPFANVDEMNKTLIENWNTVVRPEDDVYHLGDFCFSKSPEDFLSRLNGKKYLVRGNHDRKETCSSPGWVEVAPIMEVNDHGKLFVLSHFPFEVWNRSHHDSWHLHGHSHGNLPPRGNRLDVGVDPMGYFPVDFAQIKSLIEGRAK